MMQTIIPVAAVYYYRYFYVLISLKFVYIIAGTNNTRLFVFFVGIVIVCLLFLLYIQEQWIHPVTDMG